MSDERHDENLPVPIPPIEPAVTGELLPAPREQKAELDVRRLPVEESPYAPRFRFAMGALTGVALGSLVAAALLIFGPTHQTIAGPKWSNWKPDKSGADGASQIAGHVSREYQLPNGFPLVAVTGGPLKVENFPVRLAVTGTGGPKLVDGDGILYTQCGLGPRCAINTGKPSIERSLLLRREALELALYTFRYDDGIENVVALLPPRKGRKPTNAVFFRRDDAVIQRGLARPLRSTLPLPTPSVASLTDKCTQVHQIERLTHGSLFTYSFQQGQDASAFMVLQPFSALPSPQQSKKKLLPRCELRAGRTP